MSDDLHPQVAELMKKYARDLGQITPSDALDARIGRMVASAADISRSTRAHSPPVRRWRRPVAWAAAASLAVVAIGAGIVIGVRLERSSKVAAVSAMAREAAQQSAWAPGDLGMWPSDSVAVTIPAEYSAQGTLVAVNPNAKSKGKRYWIDVVVSNDGTVRIDRIVPAEGAAQYEQVEKDGPKVQVQ
jgi:hypothetical protein